MTTRIIQEASKATRRRKTLFIPQAFTLAEVLIVLGIIGLIADMTIPTVIVKTQEKIAVARLKKTYSTFENAFRMAVAQNGTPDNWGLVSFDEEGAKLEGGMNMLNNFEPYLKIIKRCDGKGDCGNGGYRLLGGAPWSALNFENTSSAMMADGTIFVFVSWREECDWSYGTVKNVCGSLGVDINGYKPPNQAGVDYFVFYITKFGIIPWGTAGDTNKRFDNNCIYKGNNFENGASCTAWVIYNENMDYLHCGNLSWGGKTKCQH